jgi:hypothetical protein
MSSPGPYDDPFVSGSDDGWDPYGGIRSQEHTQVNEVESTQIAGQDSNPNDDQLNWPLPRTSPIRLSLSGGWSI